MNYLLSKISDFSSGNRHVSSGRRMRYANVIVQQLLVSGGVVSAACIKAGAAHFE